MAEIGDYKGAMPTSDPNYDCDPYYMQGAIEMTVDGRHLFTKENSFDCILSFWHTLINIVKRISDNGDAHEYYPGSPIDIIAIHRDERSLDISLKAAHEAKAFKNITVRKREVMIALCDGAQRFFRLMTKIHPIGREEYERSLGELQHIRNKIFDFDH